MLQIDPPSARCVLKAETGPDWPSRKLKSELEAGTLCYILRELTECSVSSV